MEKEQILSTINEKLGQTSLSKRTISDYIDANLPAEGVEPDSTYWDKHTKILKSLGGNFSADVAAQVEDFKKNYKSSTVKEELHDDKRYAALEEKFDKLMGNYEKLTEQLAKKESEQTQQQLMSKVKDAMVKAGAKDEYVLKQTLRGVILDTKRSVEDITKELMTAYDSEFTACRGKGAAPRNGNSGGSDKGENSADAYWARKQKKEGWGKQPDK